MYAFDYVKPNSLAEAIEALGGEDAMPLSGGQTLTPTLKQRLAQPSKLVDISGLSELRGVEVGGGSILIKGATTHAEVANASDIKAAAPALADLASKIGDPQVRPSRHDRRVDREQRSLGLLSGRRPGDGRDDRHLGGARDRGGRLLHRALRNRAERQGTGHRGPLPGSRKGRVDEVSAAGLALLARRRVSRQDGRRRARRGHRGQRRRASSAIKVSKLR